MLHPSRRLVALLALAHAAAAVAVLLLALSWWFKLMLLLVILASAWRTLLRLFGAQRIASVTLHADGGAEFSRCNGSRTQVLIEPESTVTALMTVLLLRVEGRREALVLLADALSNDDFRRLRLWLRWRVRSR